MTWEPVKPSLAVAQEAYQVLLELNRQHKGDPELEEALAHAWNLVVDLWNEQTAARL